MSVKMVDFAFQPKTMTVPVGTTITWTNTGKMSHTATSDTGVFDTGNVAVGATSKSVTFSTAGTFPYFCKYHGAKGGAGMAGTIVVTASQAQPTATTAPAAPSGPTPSLQVHDQPITNGTITVDKVVAAQSGWVAVHMFGPDGKLLLTPLAGLIQVKAGTHTNVRVKLDRSFKAGDKLMPMLHVDMGVRGTYEFPGGPDVPVQVNGQIVMMELTVQASTAPSAPSTMPSTGMSSGQVSLIIGAALLALLTGLGISRSVRRRRAVQ
jgi:LPXTG-motif cell wall-anchored protein